MKQLEKVFGEVKGLHESTSKRKNEKKYVMKFT